MISFFKQHFVGEPLLVRAPGRVNLIGEHTDYNHGFVLPAAIDKGIDFAIAANGTDRIRLVSRDLDDRFESPLDEIAVAPKAHSWANYILGMAALLRENGYQIAGFDLAFGGNIPVGAGLSSSAALECGAGWAICQLFGQPIERMALAKMAQKAEHTWAGVMCGIMDQFASTFGQADHVIRLDCRSLDYHYFPFSTENYQIVLCDTGVSHSLASSEYNTRREECEAGVAIIQQQHPEVQALRDAN
ncbi:MAG: galactokinase family protein, partial [Bacteroidota bacterium]